MVIAKNPFINREYCTVILPTTCPEKHKQVEQITRNAVFGSMQTDFLIVGQGLAGTLLAFELMEAGFSVQLIDSPQYQKASLVAAGLINPVVFRRLTKSWLIDDLYPQLEDTYTRIEKLLGCRVYFPAKIRKVFGLGEAGFWQKRVNEGLLSHYLQAETDWSAYPELKMEQGSGWVEKAGRVDLEALITGFRKYLLQRGALVESCFEYSKLSLLTNGVCYESLQARYLIFCEGHRASQNPFFQAIQFKHTKGEVFRLETTAYQADFILNKTFFLMPLGGQQFRMGATYDWDNLDEMPTEQAKHELCARLEQTYTGNYRILQHQAGIRPTTHDRRPVLGLHPQYPQLGIFNGLGSKGCMLAPYFARLFAASFGSGQDINFPEVSLMRYQQA